MTFAAFMEAALYWPGLGYYARERSPWGEHGDYVTAPQVGAALAGALARMLVEAAAALSQDRPIDLVEYGSGDGSLMRDLLTRLEGLDAGVFGRTRVVCVERSAVGRARLSAALPPPPGGLQVVARLGDRTPATPLHGAVISNEFLDALPVERLRCQDGRLEQAWVDVQGDRLVERFRHLQDPLLFRHLQENNIRLREGQVAEVCLQVSDWMTEVASALAHGVVLTVDYGHETAALYGESRQQGTLVCQRHFALQDAPLLHVGEQDITAHVDFGNLRRLGEALGMTRGELCSLRVFLIGMGSAFTPAADARQWLALRHLLVSELGDTHRVMLQVRGEGLQPLHFGRQRLAPKAGTQEAC